MTRVFPIIVLVIFIAGLVLPSLTFAYSITQVRISRFDFDQPIKIAHKYKSLFYALRFCMLNIQTHKMFKKLKDTTTYNIACCKHCSIASHYGVGLITGQPSPASPLLSIASYFTPGMFS